MYPEKTILLRNMCGNSFTVRLRVFRDGDEAGMIACIRDEYEGSYFRQSFYKPEWIRQKSGEESITFLVAETEKDGIAGMLILKQCYPEKDVCEIASMIFRKKYRGCGLAMPFFQYGIELLLRQDYSAALSLPVLFHDVTQRLLRRLGLRAVGIVLNVFDMERVTHSYQNGRNCKHSQGIQVLAIGKKDAGMLYFPAEHRDFCKGIYDSLGVSCHIAEEITEACAKERRPAKTFLTCENDTLQQSLEIRVDQVGEDLGERIQTIHDRYPLCGMQTSTVFLNCKDPRAAWGYRVLVEKGYFFSGLKPLCGEREYMALHHPGQVKIIFEDYRLSDEFVFLVKYIEACCQKRLLNQGRDAGTCEGKNEKSGAR